MVFAHEYKVKPIDEKEKRRKRKWYQIDFHMKNLSKIHLKTIHQKKKDQY